MKKMMITTLMLFSALIAFSQESSPADVPAPKGKEIVFLDYFSYTKNIGTSLVTALRNKIIEGINSTNRVQLIDVDTQDALKVEETRRQDESALGDATSRNTQMKTLGAHYSIQGHISSVEAIRQVTDGKVRYKGSATYSLKIVDLSNGTVIGTKAYSDNGLTGGSGNTEMEAVISTFDYAALHMDDLMDEFFKMEGVILEISSEKKGKAEEVYINLGAIQGLQKAQKFDVFVEKTIAGRKSKKQIGGLSVKSVDGDDISLCKVTKGEKEIKEAFSENQKLIVISKKQTLMGGLFGN